MKMTIYVLGFLFLVNVQVKADPSDFNEEELCKKAHQTLNLKGDPTNDGTHSSGIKFQFEASGGDAFNTAEQPTAGIDMRGMTVNYMQSDIYVAKVQGNPLPWLHAVNWGNPPHGDGDTAKQLKAGLALAFSLAPTSGVHCPKEGYIPNYWVAPMFAGEMLCYRDRKGEQYSLLQIEAVCKDTSSIVFRWKNNKNGSRDFPAESDVENKIATARPPHRGQ